MSGFLPSGRPVDDELVVLSGEYVLGTLDRDEARLLEREARTDPVVADAIAAWQHALAPLLLAVAAVMPPASLWQRIETTIRNGHPAGSRSGTGTSPVLVAANTNFWRGATAAGFLLAAGIAGLAILDRPGPGPVPVATFATVGAQQAVYVAEAYPDGGLSIVALAPVVVADGRDLQLWSLRQGDKIPRSLGIMPAAGTRLAANQVPAGPAQILISLEPKGGSPTGLPTGRVLYGATLSRPE
ncbi:MAG: anti-sigma factor [Janthinobacterium lividum]